MVILIIFSIVSIFIVVLYYQSYWSKIEEHYDCINYQNYILIKESPYSKECSTYEILKKENEIWFKKEEYSLFFIRLQSTGLNTVELIGLDGYGIRNLEFKKYVNQLVHKIKSKQNS